MCSNQGALMLSPYCVQCFGLRVIVRKTIIDLCFKRTVVGRRFHLG